MTNNHAIRKAVRRALYLGALATTAGYSQGALAQDTSAEVEDIEEITVTGSRIQRQDYQSASPIVSLQAEAFKQSGTINAEELVNTLPQIVPSFSAGNNNPGNGQSWINLRGLGSERNLVLVDGKRMTPSNEAGIVDINSIPVAMVERVEVISGGASAVYGSEAIAGATNFILKDDYTGAEISAQTGVSAENDANTTHVEFLMGSDLADDRGNVMLWGTYNTRDALSKGDRAFSAQAVSGTSFFPSGHIRRAAGNSWDLAAVQDVFVNIYGTEAPQQLSNLVGNDDGTLFTIDQGLINFRTVLGQDINGNFVAQNFLPNDYSYNFEPFNNLIIPQDRLNFGAKMNYDLTEKVELYSRIMFTNYSSDTKLAPSPAPTGSNVTNLLAGSEFTVPVTNPFVMANEGLSQILASRTGDNVALPGAGADEDFIYRRRFVENGPRIESYERDVYQFITGLKGDLTDSWSFDAWLGHGKYNEQLNQDGNVSVTRVESLLDAPDGGASICEGGFNPVGANTLSAECADYIGVLAKNTQRIEQNQLEAVVSGDVFELPAGTASLAVGAYYQEIDYSFKADEILASGDVSGFNAQDNIDGAVDNTDVFLELYLPLLRDAPFVESLGLTTGYRLSDHNFAGQNNSYKAEVDWGVNETLRFRTSYQRAVRAPNVGELFEPLNEDNPQVQDPCNFDSSFRTGPNAAQVAQLCQDQGILASELSLYTQPNAQIQALQGGNASLTEETADTFTFGFVVEPEFVDGLQVSLDYYDIEIEDVITFIDPSTVVNRCFNANGFNANYDAGNIWCQKFQRSVATGEIVDLLELQENIGGLRTDGIDLQLDWGVEMGRAGSLDFNLVSTYVFEFAVQSQAGDPWQDFIGTIGQDVGEALPDIKTTLTTIWSVSDFSTSLRLRHLPSMEHEETVINGSTDPDICGCTGVDSVLYADLATRWQATDALSVRLGIDNLTDEAPQLFTPDQDSGTNPTVYDVIGRRYYVSATYEF